MPATIKIYKKKILIIIITLIYNKITNNNINNNLDFKQINKNIIRNKIL